MKTLKQFYREIQQWIDDGCPEHEVFQENRALCATLAFWLGDDLCTRLSKELARSFLRTGRDPIYPFNDDDWPGLIKEIESGTVYKNHTRLAWIKEHAA